MAITPEIPVRYYTADWASTGKPVCCRRWFYWNAGGMGIYIVAVGNFYPDGKPFQWSAYIGTSVEGGLREAAGVQEVADNGVKISEAHASHLFPDFGEHFAWRD